MPGISSPLYQISLQYAADSTSLFAGTVTTDTKLAIDSSHVITSKGMSVDNSNDRILIPGSSTNNWEVSFSATVWSGSTGNHEIRMKVKSDGTTKLQSECFLRNEDATFLGSIPLEIPLTGGEYVTLEHFLNDNSRAYDVRSYQMRLVLR